MRIRLLVLAVGLALTACFPYPDEVPIYGEHIYSCCPGIRDPNLTWHAGQSIILRWRATPPVQTTDPTRHPIVLTVSLIGPFATVEALKEATSAGSKPAGVRTVNAPPVAANDKRLEAPVSQFELPADLPPGYYNLATRATEGGQSSGEDAVVVVAPGSAAPWLSG